jgi:transcription antitermination factor NusG
MADRRDLPTWVVCELTPAGEEKVLEGTLDSALRRLLSVDADHPIFIPSVIYEKQDKKRVVNLIEGYCFIASGLPETTYFALEQSPLIEQVMSTRQGPHKMRALSTVSNDYIENFREQIKREISVDLDVGATVWVTEGKYRHLDGTVMELYDDDSAVVSIVLRSKEFLVTLPKVFLTTQNPSLDES